MANVPKKNEIISYVVVSEQPNPAPKVLVSFMPTTTENIVLQMNEARAKKGQPPFSGQILNLYFDRLTGRFYCPELYPEEIKQYLLNPPQNPELQQISATIQAGERQLEKMVKSNPAFASKYRADHGRAMSDLMEQYVHLSKNQGNETAYLMYLAAKLKATQDFGGVSVSPPISGNPVNLFRVKHTSDFPGAWEFINQSFFEGQEPLDIVVIEANLHHMPETMRKIKPFVPDMDFECVYIDSSQLSSVQFVSELRGKSTLLYNQETPFILLNLGGITLGPTDKERLVIAAYRDALSNMVGDYEYAGLKGTQLHRLSYLMYIGWPYFDICNQALAPQDIPNINAFIQRVEGLLEAARMIAKTSFGKNLSEPPFYYLFRVDRPPQAHASSEDVFKIMSYDEASHMLCLRSNAYINKEILDKIFLARSTAIVARYNPTTNLIRLFNWNEIDAKKGEGGLVAIKQDIIARGATPDVKAEHVSPYEDMDDVNDTIRRIHVSDFPQTKAILEKACKRLSNSEGKDIEFTDIEVIVGPFSKISKNFGGGYFDPDMLRKQKVNFPMAILPGLMATPPFILIDSATTKSIAEQAATIVHEYWHYIYLQKLKLEAPTYDLPQGVRTPEDIKKYLIYLSNPTEVKSHVYQMKFMLATGMNKDEVVRHFFRIDRIDGGVIPIARRYYELVQEAERLLKEEDVKGETPQPQPQQITQATQTA